MEILAILIPMSFVLIGIAGAVFVWAVNNDQFDQLDRHGFDILDHNADDEPQ